MAIPKGVPCISTRRFPSWTKHVLVLALLYGFLIAVGLMGHVFKSMAQTPEVFDVQAFLEKATSNPFLGLFVGIFVTAVAQTSSFTTAMTVGLVASGALTVSSAIPVIMGANIGSTVTNFLVALGHVTRRNEFRLAVSGATLHDVFNLITVILLLPAELIGRSLLGGVGPLEWLATRGAGLIDGLPGFKGSSPLKPLIDPAVNAIWALLEWCRDAVGAPLTVFYIVAAALSLAMLFAVLFFMVKTMRAAFAGRIEHALNSAIFKKPLTAMACGAACTAAVQSSSITTALMVPLLAGGVVTLERVFPFILGANLGTTITAVMASLVEATPGCLAVALVHLMFNVLGIALIYPVAAVRRIPLRIARWFGDLSGRHRYVCLLFVAGLFFVLPWVLIWLTERW